jgi:hypothetical protein
LNEQKKFRSKTSAKTSNTPQNPALKKFSRRIFASSGLSIQSKTKVNKIDALKEIIHTCRLNPEEILTKEASTNPNATVIGQDRHEANQIKQLSIALKRQMLKEIREEKMKQKKKKV